MDAVESVIVQYVVMAVARPVTGRDKFCCSFFLLGTEPPYLRNQLRTNEMHLFFAWEGQKGVSANLTS